MHIPVSIHYFVLFNVSRAEQAGANSNIMVITSSPTPLMVVTLLACWSRFGEFINSVLSRSDTADHQKSRCLSLTG